MMHKQMLIYERIQKLAFFSILKGLVVSPIILPWTAISKFILLLAELTQITIIEGAYYKILFQGQNLITEAEIFQA